jgi:hypothetical protein
VLIAASAVHQVHLNAARIPTLDRFDPSWATQLAKRTLRDRVASIEIVAQLGHEVDPSCSVLIDVFVTCAPIKDVARSKGQVLALNCLAAEPRAGELHCLRDAAHPQKLWGANADALEEVVEQVPGG